MKIKKDSDVSLQDQQEEVAKLLVKTREEMHAAVQSGGRSPKRLNSPAQQSKSGTEVTQSNNNTSSLSSQVKGKKRTEKGDFIVDSANKRERPLKPTDDGEGPLKPKIEKITEKGALVNVDAVEKLVQLMKVDRGERKIDLPGKKLLADIISATDKSECLDRFIQLKGVPLLDDWLQEAHRGKNGGDNVSPKEGDKSADELLLALLYALDKLPVNLDALTACNVGKSVNHLRGHKNSEIQKKARGLVDTWKKRVDAEMTMLELTKLKDEKSTGAANPTSVSLSGKPGSSDLSQGVSKRSSAEALARNLISQHSPSCKSLTGKSHSGQSSAAKLTSALTTSSVVGSKDSQPKHSTGEMPLAAIEEKSSSSGQSCSSDHAKSSTSGSTLPNKVSGGSTRQRKSSNGHMTFNSAGTQKDAGMTRSSPLRRNSPLEKCSHHGPPVEKTGDDHGNNQRLIVRLPIPGRSPARSPSCLEESTSQTSTRSVPAAIERVDHIDLRIKVKSETNAENDQKGIVDVVDGSEKSTTALGPDNSGKGPESTHRNTFDSSISPINALVESCAKYSEACVSSGRDDSGMNLLASVATGEISKSRSTSPSHSADELSPQRVKPEGSADGGLTDVAGYVDVITNDNSEKLKHNGDRQQQSLKSSEDCQTGRSLSRSKVKNENQDVLTTEASKINATEGEEDKAVLTEEDPSKLAKRKRKSSSPVCGGLPDSKNRAGNPKSDENKDPKKLCGGDVKPEEQIEKASSRTGQQILEDAARTSDSIDASMLASCTDAGVKIEDGANEEKCEIPQENFSHTDQIKCKALTKDRTDEYRKETVDHQSSSSQTEEECTNSSKADKEVNMTKKEESASLQDGSMKLDFDLNEGFCDDEVNSADPTPSSSIHLMSLQSFNSSPAPITIAAPAKGPFVPPETLLKSRDEPGWRGSAATSAFRPLSGSSNFLSSDAPSAGRLPRHHLNIDLNVADERAADAFSNQACGNSVGLDLDLNRLDESTESGQPSGNTGREGRVHMLRDFDLNNGPGSDEAGLDQAFSRGQINLGSNALPFLPSLRLNNSEISSISTWFPPGSAYPAMTIPTFMPERVDHGQQPYQRIMGSAAGGSPFGGDLYRGPVLSSSPALNFSYAGYPFGTSFPLASTSYSYPNDSAGTPPPPGFAAVSSSYMRPYVISVQEGGSGSGVKWGQQNLDLNAGPGGTETEMRASSRQISLPGSQGFIEDPSRLYPSRTMKRKEPEGSWDGERFSCK